MNCVVPSSLHQFLKFWASQNSIKKWCFSVTPGSICWRAVVWGFLCLLSLQSFLGIRKELLDSQCRGHVSCRGCRQRAGLWRSFSRPCSQLTSTFILDSFSSLKSLIITILWPNFMHISYVKWNYLSCFNINIIMCLGCGKGCPLLIGAGITVIYIESLSDEKN